MERAIQTLRELVARSEVAEKFFKSISPPAPNAKITGADYVEKQLECARGDIIEIFKLMDSLELGRFVWGRRGQPSRFLWNAKTRELGTAVLKPPDPDESATAPLTREGSAFAKSAGCGESALTQADAEIADCHEHEFWLRPGLPRVSFRLPSDLTKKEAKRIATFLKSLPL